MPSPEASLPIDPNVQVPPAVQRSIDAAGAIHKAAYNTPDPVVPPPADATATPAPAAPAPVPAAPIPAPEPAVPEPVAPIPDEGPNGSWEHRFLAMEGRYKQQLSHNAALEEQANQLADELQRTQTMIRPRAQRTAENPQGLEPVRARLTDDDLKTYGPELLDVVKRAALDAVAPELQTVKTQTRQVSQQVAQTRALTVREQLAQSVPNWKEINDNPRFKAWARQPDVYSGVLRGQLLNAAAKAADAPRVIAFFKGFLQEEVATGNAPANAEPAAAQSAPRTPAIALETLTAPGRPKPAVGQTTVIAEEPTITRSQVREFYSPKGMARYVGREKDRMADEQIIIAASRGMRIVER